MGLRESKKAKTRKMISNLATGLFVKKGYDAVTTAEIAKAAEVSVPTLFNYFPTKETLVFDDDEANEAKLVSAVLERKKGETILAALWKVFLASDALKPEFRKHTRKFHDLIASSPALSYYERNMWLRHGQALASAIRKTSPLKMAPIEAEVIANLILDGFHRSLKTTDPKVSLKKIFHLLETGCKGL